MDALRDPAHVHAIGEEYRAAASRHREHDQADRIPEARPAEVAECLEAFFST